MKRERIYRPEPRTIALVTALAIGLGIALHKVFFLFAAAIALGVPFGCFIDDMREVGEKGATEHRHV